MKMKLVMLLLFLSHTGLYAQTFSTLWQKSLGGSGAERVASVKKTADGGYIAAGYSESKNGDVSGKHGVLDYWIVKLNGNGIIEWQKSLGGTSFDAANSIAQTADGGYIVAGASPSNDGDVSGNHGVNDYWIVKLSNVGAIEWQKSLGGTADEHAISIAQTTGGGYIIAGFSNSNDGDVSENHGDYDVWIVKLSNVGAIEWQKSLGGTGGDRAESIVQTADGGYIVAGASLSNDGDVSGNHGGSDMWIVKLSNDGAIEWQKSLGGTDLDYDASVIPISTGYMIAGTSSSNDGDVSGNHGNADFWVMNLSVRNFTVSPNYPCQDKYVHLTAEGCIGFVRWYAYPEGTPPTYIAIGPSYHPARFKNSPAAPNSQGINNHR